MNRNLVELYANDVEDSTVIDNITFLNYYSKPIIYTNQLLLNSSGIVIIVCILTFVIYEIPTVVLKILMTTNNE